MYSSEYCSALPHIIEIGFYNSRSFYKSAIETEKKTISYWQIELYTSDSGSAIINDVKYPNAANKLLICPPGTKRNSILHFSCYYFHLDIPQGVYLDKFKELPLYTSMENTTKLFENFKIMIRLFYSDKPSDSIKFNLYFLDFLNDIFLNSLKTDENNASAITKSEKYMDENYMTGLSLADIAQYVNLSPVYFHRLYSKVRGYAPHKYLCDKMLNHAKFLLLSSDKPVGEIAFESGFSSHSYFNSFFKEHTGITPTYFRKTNSNKIT